MILEIVLTMLAAWCSLYVMKVMRIAHPDLRDANGHPMGPYNARDAVTIDDDELWDVVDEAAHVYGLPRRATPPPYTEGIDFVQRVHRSGFLYLWQAQRWFDDLLYELALDGWMVLVYEVPDEHVQVSDSQVAFEIAQAEVVEAHLISDLI